MSIKLRLAILLGSLLLAFGAALWVIAALEQKAANDQFALQRDARAGLLQHWIDAIDRPLPQFADDVAASEEFASFLANSDPAVTRTKVEQELTFAGLSTLWVVGSDASIRLQVGAKSILPLAASDFARLVDETPNPRFYADGSGQVFELCIRRQRAGRIRDWIVVAQRWDDFHLRRLADLADSKVTLISPAEAVDPPSPPDHVVVIRPLPDWQGHPLRFLRVEYVMPRPLAAEMAQTRVFFVFGFLVLLALALAIEGWVLRPLRQISRSLATGDAGVVRDLSGEKTELGHVAQLVRTSFEQRTALENEIMERKKTQAALEKSEAELRQTMEERARLGRDLHDGVIQSLYAAGMGLASIRPLLQTEQTEAAARLEQTRAALNETIHDVRNFISGLEPEALRSQTFAQALQGLLEVMHTIRPVHTHVSIDETLAARLTLAQRVHALQIAREAVSNALRHGGAQNVHVGLRTAGHFAEFEIIDDGSGFDVTASGPGRGLINFAERARELGAELTVDSTPGRGTTVKLVFSLFTP